MLYLVYLAMVLLMHSSSDFFIVTCVIWYFSDLTTFFKMLFICLDFNYIHLSFVPVTQQTMAAEYMIACDTNHLQLFPRSWILWELAIHKRLFVRFVLVFFFSSPVVLLLKDQIRSSIYLIFTNWQFFLIYVVKCKSQKSLYYRHNAINVILVFHPYRLRPCKLVFLPNVWNYLTLA